jgi:hypothetical protein
MAIHNRTVALFRDTSPEVERRVRRMYADAAAVLDGRT